EGKRHYNLESKQDTRRKSKDSTLLLFPRSCLLTFSRAKFNLIPLVENKRLDTTNDVMTKTCPAHKMSSERPQSLERRAPPPVPQVGTLLIMDWAKNPSIGSKDHVDLDPLHAQMTPTHTTKKPWPIQTPVCTKDREGSKDSSVSYDTDNTVRNPQGHLAGTKIVTQRKKNKRGNNNTADDISIVGLMCGLWSNGRHSWPGKSKAS
ncbi:unnamed protein product, partial [Nesidiocoris tenuis]